MGDMYDAVNPANLPAGLDGSLAVRITVLADPAAEVMDSETGNAGVGQVASATSLRADAGRWTWAYSNLDNFPALEAALHAAGLVFLNSAAWPMTGVYLWAAAPGLTAEEVALKTGVWPIAVQDAQANDVDHSTTYDTVTVRVAGYLDGPDSAWPAAAWERFTVITQPEGGPVSLSAADVEQIQTMLRAEFAPGHELYDRVIQAGNESIKESLGEIVAALEEALHAAPLPATVSTATVAAPPVTVPSAPAAPPGDNPPAVEEAVALAPEVPPNNEPGAWSDGRRW